MTLFGCLRDAPAAKGRQSLSGNKPVITTAMVFIGLFFCKIQAIRTTSFHLLLKAANHINNDGNIRTRVAFIGGPDHTQAIIVFSEHLRMYQRLIKTVRHN